MDHLEALTVLETIAAQQKRIHPNTLEVGVPFTFEVSKAIKNALDCIRTVSGGKSSYHYQGTGILSRSYETFVPVAQGEDEVHGVRVKVFKTYSRTLKDDFFSISLIPSDQSVYLATLGE